MKFKPNSFFSIYLFLCFSANATEGMKSPTHCKSDEKVIFSCPFKNGKTVSLCASPDLSKDTGTLQYRFGRIGRKPELSYPTAANHPKEGFWLNTPSPPGRWAQNKLGFAVAGYEYTVYVYTNSAIPEREAYVSVARETQIVAHMDCAMDNFTNETGMLRTLDIPIRP